MLQVRVWNTQKKIKLNEIYVRMNTGEMFECLLFCILLLIFRHVWRDVLVVRM